MIFQNNTVARLNHHYITTLTTIAIKCDVFIEVDEYNDDDELHSNHQEWNDDKWYFEVYKYYYKMITHQYGWGYLPNMKCRFKNNKNVLILQKKNPSHEVACWV